MRFLNHRMVFSHWALICCWCALSVLSLMVILGNISSCSATLSNITFTCIYSSNWSICNIALIRVKILLLSWIASISLVFSIKLRFSLSNLKSCQLSLFLHRHSFFLSRWVLWTNHAYIPILFIYLLILTMKIKLLSLA